MRNRSTALWMAGAFCAAMALAAAVLAAFGAGERGTHVALQATARLSFVLFWPAYSAAALAALFGPSFQPLQRRVREFGLAFAAAHLVHLGLVAWLSYIGNAPPLGSFIFFGIAALCTYLLALFSVARLQRALGASGWWLLRIVGLNYIAFAFAVDFVRLPASASAKYLMGYLPFVLLSVAGPALRLAAFGQRVVTSAGKLRHSGHSSH
jgi:hypothetical protein